MYEESLKRSQNKELLVTYQNFLGQLNNETQNHSFNVAALCESCAAPLGLNTHLAFKIGLLHDIGKVFIPARILKKNWNLTRLERDIVDLHSYYGYIMLKDIGEPTEVLLPILYHHGYNKHKLSPCPEIVTHEILDYVNLVHAADIFDAMTSKRVYHKPSELNVVFDMLSSDEMCDDNIVNAIYNARINSNGELRCPEEETPDAVVA